MPLSWNEIKSRAVTFSNEWKDTFNENADAKPFLDDFFNVFGITRRKQATFEHKVKKLDDSSGYIDLLWKGTVLVEMKTKNKDLAKAYTQAKDYVDGLPEHEIPKCILICDFENFHLYDLEDRSHIEFKLVELVKHVKSFQFLLGYPKFNNVVQEAANIKAAEMMGKLHDSLKAIGYTGHALEAYLVRLLFCLFAEDTTIFEMQQFQEFIERRTSEDGSDLASRLQELFQVLNTPLDKRFKNLDDDVAAFPYVNGKLFEEPLPIASFDKSMRQALLKCCYIDWSKISPAIFGSMFQSVMDEKERRNLGAHYTSETNILKVIKPLFLDELWAEFHKVKQDKRKLNDFHIKLSKLTFLDPACGCGNFLIITYRELRKLEIEILRASINKDLPKLDMDIFMLLDVNMMYGIEYEEFPARIAGVAMWLIDHQMNMLISEEFGQYFVRLPLKKAATIVHGNALRIDWETVIPRHELSYIIGNPPFYGSRNQTKNQKEDTILTFGNKINSGVFDYVACWYYKASQYIDGTSIKVCFVSTSSITQGIQVPTLWKFLIQTENLIIHFAHQTFDWNNEAKGNAAVYCVIIGFAKFDIAKKKLYEYANIHGIPTERIVSHINPYLLEAKNIFIDSRSKPISSKSIMMKGNAAIDNGNFIFPTFDEAESFKINYPNQAHLVRKFIGSDELINNYFRFCLWLKDATPNDLRSNNEIKKRIDSVRIFRESSPKLATKKWAEFPYLFMEDRQPQSDYLMIPVVSSEARKYIPIGFLKSEVIANYSSFILPNASVYDFGIISSIMHNVWIRNICGKLEGRIRYSNTLGYNNFPFPDNLLIKQKQTIEDAAQKVLDARALFPQSSLADLYDPLTMPAALVKAHNELDKAVDAAYSKAKFDTEAKRMEFLFALYEKYTGELFQAAPAKKMRKKKKAAPNVNENVSDGEA